MTCVIAIWYSVVPVKDQFNDLVSRLDLVDSTAIGIRERQLDGYTEMIKKLMDHTI
jgi:hypothetical protein